MLKKKSWLFVSTLAFVFVAVDFFNAGAVIAQESSEGPLPKEEQLDELVPITCWWRTDRSAVRIGEPFKIFLTCRAAETDSETIVPNESGLGPSVMSLPPFSVNGGARYDDVRAGGYRFFQYRYEVKFLESGFFGQEVEMPALEIPYHLETRTPRGETVVAQERVYKLPELKMKIHSLVQEEADDIWDSSHILPGSAETFRFRASVAFMAGIFFLLMSAIVAIHLGFVGVRERSKKKEILGVPPFSALTLCGRMAGELKKIRERAEKYGWDIELVAQTTSVLRVVGAVLISGNIKQTIVRTGEKKLQGHMELRRRPFLFRKVLVSSGVTAGTIRDHLNRNDLMTKPNKEFVEVFEEFSLARHGLDNKIVNGQNLDGQLLRAIKFAKKLRLLNMWPVKKYLVCLNAARKARQAWKA